MVEEGVAFLGHPGADPAFAGHPGSDPGLLGHPGIFQQFYPGRGCVNELIGSAGAVFLEKLGFLGRKVVGIGIGEKFLLVVGLIPLPGETEERIGRFVEQAEIVGRYVGSETAGRFAGLKRVERIVGLLFSDRFVG